MVRSACIVQVQQLEAAHLGLLDAGLLRLQLP